MKKSASANTAIAHLPSRTVRELDHFDYLQKLRHWARPDAWRPGGTKLVFKNPAFRIGNLSMEGGNITRSKPLIGRPCFGIATAFLRYEHATRFVKGRGQIATGRCSSCKSKDACRSVVEKRLRAVPELESAWTDWLKDGGQNVFTNARFERTPAYRSWSALTRELQKHPFTSVNDLNVSEAYTKQDNDNREKDRQRKARDRRKARRVGEIDDVDLELLRKAAKRRAQKLVGLRESTDCPRELSRVETKQLTELLQVWLGRESLRVRKMKDNAPSIARWIEETGRSHTSKNHAALSSRVVKDLKRISKWERLLWNDEPLLSPFDRLSEFPSEVKATANG